MRFAQRRQSLRAVTALGFVLALVGGTIVGPAFAQYGSGLTLTVNIAGIGSGRVISNPPGIDCPGVCSASFVNAIDVALTAIPDTGTDSVLQSWSGCLDVDDTLCRVTRQGYRAVTAVFLSP